MKTPIAEIEAALERGEDVYLQPDGVALFGAEARRARRPTLDELQKMLAEEEGAAPATEESSMPVRTREVGRGLNAPEGDSVPWEGQDRMPADGFKFSDLWDAYETGAKSGRAHPEVSDEQIGRACDAYCKTKAVYHE